MKKIFLILLMAVSYCSNAQAYKLEEKSVIGIFEADGKTKAEIFSAINKWISINYNSGKSVTQLSDDEAGNIVVKGVNKVYYKNILKLFFYENNESFPSIIPLNLNHLIEINVKDNKYRITYRITDYVSTASTPNYYMEKEAFDCINLNGSSEASLVAFNEEMDSVLKMGLKGKSKRELVLAETKPAFDEFATSLITDIKSIMLSIEKSVKSKVNDNW
jgi:hypothetical protein